MSIDNIFDRSGNSIDTLLWVSFLWVNESAGLFYNGSVRVLTEISESSIVVDDTFESHISDLFWVLLGQGDGQAEKGEEGNLKFNKLR